MQALITGATGFVGNAVTRAALQDGWQVRITHRANSDLQPLQGLDVECAQADLADVEALQQAMQGCDAVFHVAADYRLWAADPGELYENNVEGTRRICEAAQAAGVSRVVYTSSVATLGIPDGDRPGNEDTPVALADMIGHYKRSKFLAEEVVKEYTSRGQDVVIVNPSAPIGPRDHKPTPTGQMVLEAASGRMPAFVDTGLNIVHVDDVARGHLQAWQHGEPGRRYVLGGTDMTLAEILTMVADIVDRPPPRVKLPHNLVMPIAYAAETAARFTGRPPRVTVDGVKLAKKRMFFSHARADEELGYQARPARQALMDAIDWYRAQGYLSAGRSS